MSRKRRTKFRKNGDYYGMGTSHHEEYASSTSYFPKSYSAIGKQVKFPSTNALSFYHEGKITFFG